MQTEHQSARKNQREKHEEIKRNLIPSRGLNFTSTMLYWNAKNENGCDLPLEKETWTAGSIIEEKTGRSLTLLRRYHGMRQLKPTKEMQHKQNRK